MNVLERVNNNNNKLIDMIVNSKPIWQLFNKCITNARKNPKKDGKDGLTCILGILYICDNNSELFSKHFK